jgi:hypothetical protein
LTAFIDHPLSEIANLKLEFSDRVTEESAKVLSKRKGCSTNRAARGLAPRHTPAENLDHSFEIQL